VCEILKQIDVELLDCFFEVLHNLVSLLKPGCLDGAAGLIFKNLDNR